MKSRTKTPIRREHLINAALVWITRAMKHIGSGNHDKAVIAMSKCQEAVNELEQSR